MTDILTRLRAALGDRYHIERELGQGGMATVFLADDVKHERKVAIKLLTPELAAIIGAERFLKEIKVTANLQHPHILGLIDSGEADGLLWYVMPYVEGETLRDLIRRERQLAIVDAVRITSEVASALDYAHRHGVIHRDVKPENVLLHDGRAMVADFGIALAASKAGGTRMTETGLSLGTPGYMSPEQATGERELDARSDLYSLACMLYEMLVGEPPHVGPTVQAIVAAVLTKEPEPVEARRNTVPPHVAAALHTALAKLPADRFESVAHFARALGDEAFTNPTLARAATGVRAARATGRPRVVVALVVAGIAIGATAGWLVRGQPEAAQTYRYYIYGDSSRVFGDAIGLTPDGRTLVFYGQTESGGMLFTQSLDDLEPRPIAGTEDVRNEALILSPDGLRVAYAATSTLKSIGLDGSGATTIGPIGTGIFLGGVWTPDGTFYYSTDRDGKLMRISVGGGTAERVAIRADDKDTWYHSPQLLPDGKRALYVRLRGSESRIGVLTLSSGVFKPLVIGASPYFAAPGSLLYGRATGEVLVQPFSLDQSDTTGPAVRLVESVATKYSGAVTVFAASRSGTLVFKPQRVGVAQLVLAQRGGERRVLMTAGRFWGPRFSPDGRTVGFGAYDASMRENADLWTIDVRSGTDQRLTTGGQRDLRDFNDLAWSRDGRQVVMSGRDSLGTGRKDLFVMRNDGTSLPTRVLQRPEDQWPTDWSADGTQVLFTENPVAGTMSIWTVPANGRGTPTPVVQTSYNASAGRLSPDGRWLAYQSDETGQAEVYVQPYPGPGPRVRVSNAGGMTPMWTRGGTELIYFTRGQFKSVALSLGRTIEVGARQTVLEANLLTGTLANFDVTSDGQQFVIITVPPSPNRLAVVSDVFGRTRQ